MKRRLSCHSCEIQENCGAVTDQDSCHDQQTIDTKRQCHEHGPQCSVSAKFDSSQPSQKDETDHHIPSSQKHWYVLTD